VLAQCGCAGFNCCAVTVSFSSTTVSSVCLLTASACISAIDEEKALYVFVAHNLWMCQNRTHETMRLVVIETNWLLLKSFKWYLLFIVLIVITLALDANQVCNSRFKRTTYTTTPVFVMITMEWSGWFRKEWSAIVWCMPVSQKPCWVVFRHCETSCCSEYARWQMTVLDLLSVSIVVSWLRPVIHAVELVEIVQHIPSQSLHHKLICHFFITWSTDYVYSFECMHVYAR